MRARVEQLEKKNANLKVNKKEELDKVEQRGSNLCFEGQIEAFKKIQGRLFQAGYDFGLNEVLIPPTSSLRVPISILGDFKYADDEEDDGDEDSSQTGGQEALARSAAGAQGGGNAGGTTVANDVEDTADHDLFIHVD